MTIPYSIKKSYGLLSMILTAIASTIVQCYLISYFDLSTSFLRPGGLYYDIYYIVPYCRINTYLIGILVSWVYASYKFKGKNDVPTYNKLSDKIINSRIFRYGLYLVGITCTTTSLMLNHLIDHYGARVKPY